MGVVTGALLIVSACVGVAVLGLWLSRRRLAAMLPRQNDLSAAVLGVIGTLYGVLLALVTITVLERYTLVEGLIVTETSLIWDLHRNVAEYPPDVARVLQRDLRAYVDAVITDEWPALRRKRESPETQRPVSRFMQHLARAEPRTTGETVLHLVTLQKADDFEETRRRRLFHGRSRLVPLLWVVLIIGAVVTVGSSYAFWAESLTAHALLTAALSALIGLTLYLIASLDHPLWGSNQSLQPAFFELIRERMAQEQLP